MTAAQLVNGRNDDIPPLENGDVLDRAEFERRYEAMPDLKKAELIDGVVYLGSPVYRDHYRAHLLASAWLGSYLAANPTLDGGDNGTVILGEDEVQPDLFLRKPEGASSMSGKLAVLGPPEFVMEIASSSVSSDLHMKLDAYRRAGVREYVVWRVRQDEIDWFELVDDRFLRRTPEISGIIESRQFPGLRLDAASLIASFQQRGG